MDAKRLMTCLLPAMLLLPAAAGEAPASAEGAATNRCANALCSLGLYVNATVVGCDASACVVDMRAAAVGSHHHPGVLHVRADLHVLDDAAAEPCLGPPAAPTFSPCETSCRGWTVGQVVSCESEHAASFPVAAGGCTDALLDAALTHDLVSTIGAQLWLTVCRDDDGAASIFVWG